MPKKRSKLCRAFSKYVNTEIDERRVCCTRSELICCNRGSSSTANLVMHCLGVLRSLFSTKIATIAPFGAPVLAWKKGKLSFTLINPRLKCIENSEVQKNYTSDTRIVGLPFAHQASFSPRTISETDTWEGRTEKRKYQIFWKCWKGMRFRNLEKRKVCDEVIMISYNLNGWRKEDFLWFVL